MKRKKLGGVEKILPFRTKNIFKQGGLLEKDVEPFEEETPEIM
jgi:hypothetical protein